ncbi:CDP-alcohol phosphatidyltransferase family protein [Alsobacter sp. SYSU M60028]|uniref:CDP-diacylglycerol--glycerol-3-phosphate 3-phosphatidyltransferase n=1 Tax=Alsobacter ponti TaxID=2962936 RepID=A0ABT1LEN8_9HYPH|nr:CDP-alcohol phosphatidyltransferase family protein [Alsobacter ponti]MCP8939368.1 CDP-alcohol phosphatidyltransferase family protein [Alsobacter ponti]
MNLPNLITIGRLFLVPFVVAMISQGQWHLAFIAFVVAGVSDAVDGYIARRWDMRSELGAYLDPLADKALLVCIYVSLAIVGHLPVWLAIVVVSRDMMIVGAVVLSWLMDNPVEINPSHLSKANTAAQLALAAVFLGLRSFDIEGGAALDGFMFAVAVLTGVSAADYLARWLRHMTS